MLVYKYIIYIYILVYIYTPYSNKNVTFILCKKRPRDFTKPRLKQPSANPQPSTYRWQVRILRNVEHVGTPQGLMGVVWLATWLVGKATSFFR